MLGHHTTYFILLESQPCNKPLAELDKIFFMNLQFDIIVNFFHEENLEKSYNILITDKIKC